VSEENVELFRRLTAVAEVASVPEEAESLLAPLLAPEYLGEALVTAVTDKTYYGTAGCVEWFNDLSDAFAEGVRYEVEGSSRMATTSLSGAWPSSGPPLDPVLRFACVGSPSPGSTTARPLEAQATQTGTTP
jgi:hypothetical protein